MMTYQDFNHIYYTFTKNRNGIRGQDRIQLTGYELKEFIEYAIEKYAKMQNQNQLKL